MAPSFPMNTPEAEITEALRTLDPEEARSLGRVIHEVLVRHRVAPPVSAPPPAAVDEKGWPVGYWEKFAGCLAGDDWEPSPDPPPEPHPG